MHRQDDYFGIPEQNFILARRWMLDTMPYKVETRVPTRKEVCDLPCEQLHDILIGWMVHSPPELTPSSGQIAIVLELLGQRDDAHRLEHLRAMCGHYVHGA